MHPAEYLSIVNQESLSTVPVDPRAARDAVNLFREEAAKSYSVDLAELSGETWWLVPTQTDLLAEVRTRRFGTLTYAHANNEPEDITVFDREKRRNISVYASQARIASRGRFYAEDDLADYDVIDYGIDLSYSPERIVVRGARAAEGPGPGERALDDEPQARLVAGRALRHDRHDGARARPARAQPGQPRRRTFRAPLTRDAEFTMTVAYAGPLDPQTLDSEAVGVQQEPVRPRRAGRAGHRARAQLLVQQPQLLVPAARDERLLDGVNPSHAAARPRGRVHGRARGGVAGVAPRAAATIGSLYVFTATQPVRYLGASCRASSRVTRASIPVPRPKASSDGAPAATRCGGLRRVEPPHAGQPAAAHARGGAARSRRRRGGVLRGPDARRALPELHARGPREPCAGRPQPGLFRRPEPAAPGVAVLVARRPGELRQLPGVLPRPRARAPVVGAGRRLAELPRAVAERGVRAVLRRALRRAAPGPAGVRRRHPLDEPLGADACRTRDPCTSDTGSGIIKGDSRVTRALVYNKGAMVLHMLRRIVGDEVFFRALRRFYTEHRFRKAGTDALREAFTAESGRDLTRFFDQLDLGSGPAARAVDDEDRGPGRGAGRSCSASSKASACSTSRSPSRCRWPTAARRT